MIIGYICRHGQTEWNLSSIAQGWKDSPLTSFGKKHAKELSIKLSNLDIKKIISSDLGRAVETAKIINSKLSKDILLNSNIREMSYGDYNGATHEILINENKGHHFLSYKFSNGESPEIFINRISEFFNSFDKKYGKEPFLIVTHQGVIKSAMILAGKMKEEDFFKREIPHESIARITIENNKITSFDFL